MSRFGYVLSLLIVCSWPVATRAQELPFDFSKQLRIETIAKNHYKLIGAVEIQDGDTRFAADEVEYFGDQDRLIAVGNVVFSSGTDQIAADRADFNMKTRLGTFYNASGSGALKKALGERSQFGTQEPDFYFYGEKVEKIGADRYRITRGGFTTCLQPTPRWQITSSSVTINLDDYAVLRNAFLKVKNIPVLYVPVLYYPIQEDDRATGFLIPSYGASTLRGQTISNAFFWAINRSHDATIFHDWFSKAGQSIGGEYRYMLTGGQGNARSYFLNEKARTLAPTTPGGMPQPIPGAHSYKLTGQMVQRLPMRLQGRALLDYFSDVRVQQTYHSNILDASQRTRQINTNVTGAWGTYATSATYDYRDIFYGQASEHVLDGSTPRLSISRAQRPLFDWPVYVSFGGEYAHLLRERRTRGAIFEEGLDRLDVRPAIRFPFTQWQFLTFNSSASWRHTLYSERLDPASGRRLEDGLHRKYLEFQSEIVGPRFTRIWDTPNNFYAERFKHVIEPFYNIRRVTSIPNRRAIVPLEPMDQEIGGVTQLGYGVINRFYSKRKEPGAPAATAREFLTVALHQRYYSNEEASAVDPSFGTSFRGTQLSKFSPVALSVRAAPTSRVNGDLQLEVDSQVRAIRTIRASGTYLHGDMLDVRAGWTQQRFLPGVPGFDNRLSLSHSLNGQANLRFKANRYGGGYSFNYDFQRSTLLQQQFVGYYNAQCCGIVAEYQVYNFRAFLVGPVVPQDRRFNISFTLAGIGTFSNPFGALGGQGRR